MKYVGSQCIASLQTQQIILTIQTQKKYLQKFGTTNILFNNFAEI